MIRLLLALPALALAVLIAAWASEPIAGQVGSIVAGGFADGERAIGVGCGVAVVVLAAGVVAVGLLIVRQGRRQVELHTHLHSYVTTHRRPELPAAEPGYIETSYQEVATWKS